jgi:hypothetical protein
MDIDWGTIVTQVLTAVLPTLITVAVSYLVKQWADLKKSEKYGQTFGIIESLAATFITAADQLGNAAGWDGAARKAYVIARLKTAIAGLPVKFTDVQLEEILDGVLEGVFGGMKAEGLTNYVDPKAIESVVTEPEAVPEVEAAPAE